jgi:hypothetical protein
VTGNRNNPQLVFEKFGFLDKQNMISCEALSLKSAVKAQGTSARCCVLCNAASGVLTCQASALFSMASYQVGQSIDDNHRPFSVGIWKTRWFGRLSLLPTGDLATHPQPFRASVEGR